MRIRATLSLVLAAGLTLFVFYEGNRGQPSSVAALPDAVDQPHRLTLAASWKGMLTHGASLELEFRASAAELLHLRVCQDRADVMLEVLDPDGRTILKVDRPEGWEDPEDAVFEAATTGVYTLRVRLLEPRQAVSTVEILERRPALESDRRRLGAEDLTRRAEAARRRGRLQEAQDFYALALESWSDLGETHHVGHIHRRLGRLHHEYLERTDLAIMHYEAAVRSFEAVGHQAHKASSLWALGRAQSDLQRFEEAAASYQAAIPGLIRDEQSAFVLNELGWIHQRWGELQEARSYFDLSIGKWRHLFDSSELATALHNRGHLYLKLGRPDLSRADLEEAAGLFRERRSIRGEALSATALGNLELSEGDLPKALNYYRNSLTLYREEGDRMGQAIAHNNIGLVHRQKGRWREAELAYREALVQFRVLENQREQANSLHNLAVLKLSRRHLDEALLLWQEAWSTGGEAIEAELRAALSITAAEIHQERGDLEEAILWIQKASSVLETIRAEPANSRLRATFLSRKSRYFDLCVDLFLERAAQSPATVRKALECSERGRGRSLLDRIENPRVHSSGSALGAATREPRTRPSIEALERQATILVEEHDSLATAPRSQLEELLRGIESLEERQADGVSQPRPWAQIQERLLDAETGLLHYHLGRDRSYVWWVTADSIEVFPLPPEAEISNLVRSLHRLLVDQRLQPKLAESYLEEISAQLLRPVAQRLDRQRLMISAHGALQYLPFALLPDPREADTGGRTTRLLERHTLLMVPSASVALALAERSQKSQPGTLGALGDPIFERSDQRLEGAGPVSDDDRDHGYPRLSHTRTEIEQIALGIGAEGRQILLGFEASLEPFLDHRFSAVETLHVASHGERRADHPGLSFILLSRFGPAAQPRPGYLFAFRVETLPLEAELVVLSSCSSGLGAEIDGEGLVGLPGAFFAAGARQVVVSLWDIGDARAAELMVSFYRSQQAGLAPAEALRAAQIEQERKHPGDFSWAAFVYIGAERGALAPPTKKNLPRN